MIASGNHTIIYRRAKTITTALRAHRQRALPAKQQFELQYWSRGPKAGGRAPVFVTHWPAAHAAKQQFISRRRPWESQEILPV